MDFARGDNSFTQFGAFRLVENNFFIQPENSNHAIEFKITVKKLTWITFKGGFFFFTHEKLFGMSNKCVINRKFLTRKKEK